MGDVPLKAYAAVTCRIFELVLLLGCVPLLAMTGMGYSVRHLLLLTGCIFVAWRLRGYISWRGLFARPPMGWWLAPVLRGCIVFVLAVLYVWLTEPHSLFSLPRKRPEIWGLVVLLYPLLSVLPQEIIYRVYIFETHASLWRSPALPVCVSALSFGWVHTIYAGWFAVVTTAVAGAALALVYQRRRLQPGAIWPLVLEHSLYGLTMFTVGLGRYFFLAR